MQYNDNNILCLEYFEFSQICPSKGTYDSLKARGNIIVHGRGGLGNEILIEYDTLPKKYKEKVKEVFGDPRKYIIHQPIKRLIVKDLAAEAFYMNFIIPQTQSAISDENIQKYTWAASYLNTISALINDKKALKDNLNVSISMFWEYSIELLRAENIKLPLSEKRLRAKLDAYKKGGYASIIELSKYGNSNSKKVDDDVAEALLIEMLSHDHAHDYTRVAKAYNEWAIEAGKPTISSRAVTWWANKNAHLITAGREGKAVNYNKFNKQILRDRPSAPLLLVNSDDNVLDLYFLEEKYNTKGHAVKNPYYRPVLYVVIDAFNDYILGYAIAENVTIELIKEAYRNAENHIKQLLNGYYLPHQIQTDRWGLGKGNELEQFYQSMAVFTPATLKVAQAKYIERSFGTTWHQELKTYRNYAGTNITSKTRLNPEAIERNKKDYPTVEMIPQQVAHFVEKLRQCPNPKTGVSRQKEWLNAFENSEKSKKRQISLEQHLNLFGVLHKTGNGGKNRLKPEGLQIMDSRFQYEIPAYLFPQHVNKAVEVYYDPYDMSQVLVTDGKGLRFIAESYQKSPSALADHTPETRRLLNERLEEKKAISAVPFEEQDKRRKLLEREKIDAESLLQGGVLVKQIRHTAEKAIQNRMIELDQPKTKSIYDKM